MDNTNKLVAVNGIGFTLVTLTLMLAFISPVLTRILIVTGISIEILVVISIFEGT